MDDELEELKRKIKKLFKENGFEDNLYFHVSRKSDKYVRRSEKNDDKLFTCIPCNKTLGVESKEYHLTSKKHLDKVNGVVRFPSQERVINCGCGKSVKKKCLKAHLSSLIHKNFLENGTVYIQKEDSMECPCGGKYTERQRKSHFKTKRHIKYLNNFR